jgi:hypothetical protein
MQKYSEPIAEVRLEFDSAKFSLRRRRSIGKQTQHNLIQTYPKSLVSPFVQLQKMGQAASRITSSQNFEAYRSLIEKTSHFEPNRVPGVPRIGCIGNLC